MKAFWALTKAEFKLNLRNIIFLVATILMPILLIFMFGGLYGNDPSPKFGGYGAISASIPAYIVLTLAIIALTGLPLQMVNYKENKILKRLKASPIKISHIFLPIFLNYLILYLLSFILLLSIGAIFYNVTFDGNVLEFALSTILSITAMFSLGFLLSCLIGNVKQITAIGFAILIPMIFLSGATMPMGAFPEAMTKISKAIPLTYAVEFMQNTFLGKPLSESIIHIIVLLGISIICTLLSLKLFKWE